MFCCSDSGDGNVTAAKDGDRALAVLVVVHGESYHIGSGNAYDASVLAVVGRLVVITLNYRLGVLGRYRIPTTQYSILTIRSIIVQTLPVSRLYKDVSVSNYFPIISVIYAAQKRLEI